ncbi:MAG: DUF465 domain-containing protein [Campylobacterota bacterium]|nr:DUF465 domain-containing protein [Campylobacterota bacterium]
MLHEYRDIITDMKKNEDGNAHFLRIFDKHNDLDDKITSAEHGDTPMTDLEIETLKKEKLKLKDEAYSMIMKYKHTHNL